MTSKTDIVNLFENLGQDLSVDTFSDRKKLQKIVYLSEVFGINMGFKFHWYIHGPYSPRLTRIMFDKEKGSSLKIKDIPNFQRKVSKLKNFLGDDIISSENLELISSIHYVSSLVTNPKESKTDIIETIVNEKPKFSKKEIEQCYNRVIELFN